MKILQLTYNLGPGGAERFIVDLCNQLSNKEDNDVYLLAINDDSIPKNRHYLNSLSDKVHYMCAQCSKGISIRSLFKVYKIIKELKPDIVHAHCSLLLLLLPSLFLKKIKYVHTLHTLAEKNTSHKLFKRLERNIYSNRVQAVTISNVCNNSFINYYNTNDTVCINNGREPISTSNEFNNVREYVETLKTSKYTPVFIHVATFLKPKNQQMLFDSFMRLENEGKDFLLLVLGNCYENCTHPYKEKGKQIIILGRKENVGDYMACADFFVMSSIWEGLPLSLLEAMSIGLIPICTPAGGIVDVIKNGENGFITKTFEEKEYYEILKKCIDKEINIDKENVKQDYMNKYTMEICTNKYLDVYNELLIRK